VVGDLDLSCDVDAIVVFSIILGDMEVLMVANTASLNRFDGHVPVDTVVNSLHAALQLEASNLETSAHLTAFGRGGAVVGKNSARGVPFQATYIHVGLSPMEFQLFTLAV
jgi:hypothetical protein